RAPVVAVGEVGLKKQGKLLERGEVDAMRAGDAAGRLNRARRRSADRDVHVSDVLLGEELGEAPASVIRAGDVAAARLPRDVDRPVRRVDRDVRLGGVVFSLR